MEANYHLPKDVVDSFQELITSYNRPDLTSIEKTKNLKKINKLVKQHLDPESSESAKQIKNLLKEVKIRSDDVRHWSKIMKKIEEVLPTTSDKNLPLELLAVILENPKDLDSLSKSNKHFHQLLKSPRSLNFFLDKFSSQLSPEKRYELALKCGDQLTKLDLSEYKEFDDEKLKELKKVCPHLQFLNVAGTSITTLDHLPEGLRELSLKDCKNLIAEELTKLASFSKLEILDVSGTKIANLDHFPNNLKTLNLAYCVGLTAEELTKLASFSKLENLDVSRTKIKRLDLPKDLKMLNIAICVGLPPIELTKLASFSKLKDLNASVTQIQSLDQLPRGLENLNLTACYGLKKEDLLKLSSFDQLRLIYIPLSIYECYDEAVSVLKANNKTVKIGQFAELGNT